jgi:hypothetical protein
MFDEIATSRFQSQTSVFMSIEPCNLEMSVNKKSVQTCLRHGTCFIRHRMVGKTDLNKEDIFAFYCKTF